MTRSNNPIAKTTATSRKLRYVFTIVGIVFSMLAISETGIGQDNEWMDSRSSKELRAILQKDAVPAQRAAAAGVLGHRIERANHQALIAALNDPDDKVRESVILALGQMRSRRALPEIVKILSSDKNMRLRQASAFSLGLIRDSDAVEPLIAALRDPDPGLRTNITIALGRLGDPRAVEPLLALPHDENHETCAPIAIALGQIKSDVASEKLFNWINSPEGDICPNAAIALVLIGGRKQVEALIQVLDNTRPVSRRSAAYALGALGDKRAVMPLIDRLGDSDTQVRINAIDALGRLNDKRALAPLREIAEKDQDEQVRKRAESAIKSLEGGNNGQGF